MMTIDAAHVGELGPLVAACVTGEVVERLAERGGLADGKGASAVRIGSDGVFAAAPVRRHRFGVVVQFKRKDGMAGRDQLVIDFLVVVAEVAGKTSGST